MSAPPGGNIEQVGDEGGLGGHGGDLPLTHHGQALVAGERPARGVEALEPEPWPDQPFDPPVILFHDVIQVLTLVHPGKPPQLALLLHRLGRTRVSGVLVHRESARVHRVRLLRM